MKIKKLFILDVSGYIFRAYYALPAMTNAKGESTQALYGFIRSVFKLIKDFSPEHLVAVFDGPDNKKQRLEIYEKYKANRIQKHEDLPEQINQAKKFCEIVGIPHIEVPGVEADDTMGSMAVWAASQEAEVYLCTSDKDLCQLVGDSVYALNTWKDNLIIDAAKVEELFGVKPTQIIDFLSLTGDTSDNIPGLPGIGPKTAVSLLKEYGSLDALLENAGQIKGKKGEILKENADTALLSRRLATIYTDIEFPKDPSYFSLCKPDTVQLKAFYMEHGFSSLAKELGAVVEEKKVEYHLVDTEEELEALIATLKKAPQIAFDVETTHLRPLLAQPVGIGFCVKEAEAYYVPMNGKLGKKVVMEALEPLFSDPELYFFAHNAKYDLHVLANLGIRIANLGFDTILASYLLNSASRQHSLDHLSLHYFGKVKIPIKALIGTGKKEISMDLVPIADVCTYCCEDVDYTFRIQSLLKKELIERGLETLLYELELPLTRVLAKMERAGMYLDVEAIQSFAYNVNHEIAQIQQEIYALAGEEFNLNSPKQLSQILFEKLKIKPLKKTTTGLSTAADVLETLSSDYPIAEKILTYRSLEKLRSTYIETLPLEVNPSTHRVHPTFNQAGTATGRLACQDPNLQNIPVRTAQGRLIREAFRPEKKGWSYLAADYSQIELRLLAHLSEDPELIHAFRKGEDIHTFTASLIFDIPLDQVDKTERHRAKAINFGIIYGQQAYGLSQELGIEVKEALAFIEAYFVRYPNVLAFINTCIETARNTGKSVTMTGRERDLPEISSQNAIIRSAAERLAINTPLQGSAADLIKLAMLEIDSLLQKEKMEAQMVLQVHDELIFEAPDHELPKLETLVKKGMEGIFSLKVPLVVDVNIGKNWAEC